RRHGIKPLTEPTRPPTRASRRVSIKIFCLNASRGFRARWTTFDRRPLQLQPSGVVPRFCCLERTGSFGTGVRLISGLVLLSALHAITALPRRKCGAAPIFLRYTPVGASLGKS